MKTHGSLVPGLASNLFAPSAVSRTEGTLAGAGRAAFDAGVLLRKSLPRRVRAPRYSPDAPLPGLHSARIKKCSHRPHRNPSLRSRSDDRRPSPTAVLRHDCRIELSPPPFTTKPSATIPWPPSPGSLSSTTWKRLSPRRWKWTSYSLSSAQNSARSWSVPPSTLGSFAATKALS